MKKIKISLLILFFVSSTFTFNRCEDPACASLGASLPDLLVQSLDLAAGFETGNISVNQVINMGITVGNVIDATNTCYETLSAGNHNYNLDLYFSEDGLEGTFEKVASGMYSVTSLIAGGSFSGSGSGTPNVAGHYYFKGVEDSQEAVEERDEYNNDRDADIGGVQGGKTTKVFYVAPTKEYEERIAKGEEIEFFTFHESENFVSYTSEKYIPNCEQK